MGLTVKEAESIKLEPDVYSRCVATAKGYYRMLQRQREIEEKIDRLKERIEAIGKPH